MKAGLKAEADTQIGKPTDYEKKIEIYARQARRRAGVQRYKAGSSGPWEGWYRITSCFNFRIARDTGFAVADELPVQFGVCRLAANADSPERE